MPHDAGYLEASHLRAGSDEPSKRETADGGEWGAEADPAGEAEEETKPEEAEERDPPRETGFQDISERWGFDYRHGSYGFAYPLVEASRAAMLPDLPETVPWVNRMQFIDLNEHWAPVYEVNGRAVLMERRLGQGSVVLCADSFFLSNEALRDHGLAPLLAWLVGPNHRVIFDEAHLGLGDREHLVQLARELRLHGFLALLLALAGLFVWRQTYTLVPRRAQADEDAHLADELGRDAGSALVSLLRRAVKEGRLLQACFREWDTARGADAVPRPGSRAYREMHQIALETRGAGVAEAYGRLCGLVKAARRQGATTEGKDGHGRPGEHGG